MNAPRKNDVPARQPLLAVLADGTEVNVRNIP